jgi:hypothetical protein
VDDGRRDPLDDVITLAEAGALSGKAPHTLKLQAASGRLRAKKAGHTWITTRHWLEQYLRTRARRAPGRRNRSEATGRSVPSPVEAAAAPRRAA